MLIDNIITAKSANSDVGSKRSLHFQRRTAFVQGNHDGGIFDTKHVTDAENFTDFLGKWVPTAKYKASVEFAMNAAALVPAWTG